MKYLADRHFLYPVLRSDSDDYPGGSFTTQIVAPQQIHGNAILHLTIKIGEESLEGALREGKAFCGAVLRCSATYYRRLLSARPKGDEWLVEASVPFRLLHDRLELDPVVWMEAPGRWAPTSQHEEYGNRTWSLRQGAVLALAPTWVVPLGEPETFRSLVEWHTEDDDACRPDWRFRLVADPSRPHLEIWTTKATRDALHSTPDPISRASFYLGAVQSALLEMVEEGAVISYSEDCRWVPALQRSLERKGISVETLGHPEGLSWWEAAQVLLDDPYVALSNDVSAENLEDVDV